MKRKFAAIIAVLFLYLSMASFTYAEPVRADNSEAEKELADNVNDIVDNLDLAELEAYLATLSESQRAVIGTSGLKDRIKAVISGNLSDDYGSFLSYIASVLGVNIVNYLPIIVSVITIAVAYSLMSSLRGKFASDYVQNIVYLACVALLIVVLFTNFFANCGCAKNRDRTQKPNEDYISYIAYFNDGGGRGFVGSRI